MDKEKKLFLAKLISFIFDGIKLTPFIVFLAINLVKPKGGVLPIFFLSFFMIYFLPFVFWIYLRKIKKISDSDISRREERPLFFSLIFLCICFFLFLLFLLKENELLLFFLKLCFPLFLFFLITFFWKISGHMFLNSFFVQLLYLNTHKSIILYLGIFLLATVGWARISLKKHSLGQVVAGALLPLVLFFIK